MNVLVVGYYNHFNLGDEQYKISIRHILQNLAIVPDIIDFIDCDQLLGCDTTPYSVILLGGGDVLNHYFLDKINSHPVCSLRRTSECEYTPSDMGTVDRTPYRMEVNKKFADREGRRPKVVAFSVGIPYDSIFLDPENRKKLDIFDSIWLRTRQDLARFSQYYPADRLYYIPDASCFLLDDLPPVKTPIASCNVSYRKLFQSLRNLHVHKKIVNVNLCRHIYHRTQPYRDNYNGIVRELAIFIENLTKNGYVVLLLPFNTKPTLADASDENNHENDILIQQDVLRHVHYKTNVLYVDFSLSVAEVLSLYPFFYMSIPMRFHGTLFSIHAGVPMIPIYTTKKIKNILLDIDWRHAYPLEKNEKDLPVRFDSHKIMGIFQECVKSYARNKLLLKGAYENFRIIYRQIAGSLCDQIYTNNTHELDAPIIMEESTPKESDKQFSLILPEEDADADADDAEVADDIPPEVVAIDTFVEVSNGESLVGKLAHKLQAFAREHGYQDFRDIRDPALQQIAVCVVSYFLVGQIDSNYNHGLTQKMFSRDYDYEKEWNWVLRQTNCAEALVENPNGIVDIGYIDQNDKSGAHRSGWKYVYDNILGLHSSAAPIQLDLYVDRTFHWKLGIYREIGVVPYVRPWLGFVHHTFDTGFSEYNNHALLKCPEFVSSLRTCRGLIVLSHYLKQQFEQHLETSVPPIFVLRHPTETNVPQFNMAKFLANPHKKLVQIGGWLRNIFAFYQLQLSDSYRFDAGLMLQDPHVAITNLQPAKSGGGGGSACCCPWWPPMRQSCAQPSAALHPSIQIDRIHKVALKGRFMDNYFPSPQTLETMRQVLAQLDGGGGSNLTNKFCSQHADSTVITHNWWKHMMDYIDNACDGLEVMSAVDNTAYDALLVENLVFVNLVDGSAVNTLVECVVRNTPIVINRHPAVVEVLGENYPLYYTNIMEIDGLFQNTTRIRDAHLYMKYGVDKTPYEIDTFVRGLTAIVRAASENT